MSDIEDLALRTMQAEARALAAEFSRLFGTESKLTIIVRNPKIDDGCLIVSDDDLAGITGALRNVKWSAS